MMVKVSCFDSTSRPPMKLEIVALGPNHAEQELQGWHRHDQDFWLPKHANQDLLLASIYFLHFY